MKLIIFLLLTVSAWGQGASDTSSVKLVIRFDESGCRLEKAITITDLIDLWDTYKAECWADSTVDSIGVELEPREDSWYVVRYKTIVTHRPPDPFEFIDKYLRKKSKGEIK